MAELWDQELYISYNLTFNKSRRWAPRDRRAGSEGLKLKMTLKVFCWATFSQLGGRVYRRLEAARPLRGARVEVFFPANEHHIVSGETWVHQSVMTRAIAVWWSEKRLDQKYVMSYNILVGFWTLLHTRAIPHHKRPHTVAHNFSFFISFHVSDTVTCSFLFAPVKVLTCHRLGCDLDVTRPPGIVLDRRGSSQQAALEISLSESGLDVLSILSVCLHDF